MGVMLHIISHEHDTPIEETMTLHIVSVPTEFYEEDGISYPLGRHTLVSVDLDFAHKSGSVSAQGLLQRLTNEFMQYGIGDLPQGDSSSGILISAVTNDCQSLQAVVGIDDLVNQEKIAMNIAHAAHILNAAVNVSCSRIISEVRAGEFDAKMSKVKSYLTLQADKSQQQLESVFTLIKEVWGYAFSDAEMLIRSDPGMVLAGFDFATWEQIMLQLDDKTLASYLLSEKALQDSFTYFSTPHGILNDNFTVVPVIMRWILINSQNGIAHKQAIAGIESQSNLSINMAIDAFLNTDRQHFHDFLLQAAKGPNGSILSDGAALAPRLKVDLVGRQGADCDWRLRLGFIDSQQALLKREMAHKNKRLKSILDLISGPLAAFCEIHGIMVTIKPTIEARYQQICPVLSDAGQLDNSRVKKHRGYESIRSAYMDQVDLIYELLTRFRLMYQELPVAHLE